MPVLTIVFCDLLLNAFANIDDTLLLIFKLALELLLLFALLLLLLVLLLGVVDVAGCVLILLAVNAAAADNSESALAAPLTPVPDPVPFGHIGDIGGVLPVLGIAVVFV